MNRSNIVFLSSVLVMSVFGITSVSAAPSVKMLGTNTSRIGTNTAVVKSDNVSTASTQRLGSVRAKGVTSGTPVTVNKVPTKLNTATDSGDEARLSLGKYIHTTGVSAGTIKPATGTTGAVVSSSDLDALVDRVQALERDKFTIGDGLVVDENNKVSLSAAQINVSNSGITAEKVTSYDGVADAVNDATTGLAQKANAADVYTKTEIDGKDYLTSADVSGKANAADVYTKTEIDGKGYLTSADVSGKANAADVYTKTEIDNAGYVTSANVETGSKYVYTSNGWDAITVEDTFDPDFDFGG